jgi:tricorn protease
LLLEKLARRRIGYDFPRWSQPEPYPAQSPTGPMVALTNEQAGSDGDIFSHAFKLYKLGPLVGKRTWGGVIGIAGRHRLADGTLTTQPEFAFFFDDVGWGVENYGTDPDIEVDVAPQDHAANRDPQLDRAIAEVLRLLEERPPAVPAFDERPVLTPPARLP